MHADVVEAIATVVAAGGAICIPAVVWYSAYSDKREAQALAKTARIEADAKTEAAAMNALAQQWQDYNLAVASSRDMARILPDDAFRKLYSADRRRLHYAFFKLTALHQVFEALERRAIHSEWAEVMLKEIGATVFEDRTIADIALSGRGYTDHFKRRLRWYDPQRAVSGYGHDVEEPPTEPLAPPQSSPSPWPKRATIALVALVALAVLVTSIALVFLSDAAEPRDCVEIRDAMRHPTRTTRRDLPAVYTALGCARPQS